MHESGSAYDVKLWFKLHCAKWRTSQGHAMSHTLWMWYYLRHNARKKCCNNRPPTESDTTYLLAAIAMTLSVLECHFLIASFLACSANLLEGLYTLYYICTPVDKILTSNTHCFFLYNSIASCSDLSGLTGCSQMLWWQSLALLEDYFFKPYIFLMFVRKYQDTELLFFLIQVTFIVQNCVWQLYAHMWLKYVIVILVIYRNIFRTSTLLVG